MSNTPRTREHLPLEQKLQVNYICDRFEAAWKIGEPPAIEAYLAGVTEPLQLALLRELVWLDAHYRRRRGETPQKADYATRFPQLSAGWLVAALAPPSGPNGETPTANPAATQTVALAPPAAGTRLGDYELLEVLGRGGMGVVWKALQLNANNRLVAVKLILAGELAEEADVRRFRAEAEIAAGLDHPNLVPLYEVGEDRGRPFFSMKLIAGGHLGQHLGHFRQRPREAAALLQTVARAVQHAHQHGLLHRDLKPGNILLEWPAEGGAAPVPHVTDFGLARRLEAPAGLTQSGAIVGTPEYMAPEQARGDKAALTTATDVYGLGAVLYAVLTGRPPFQGESVLQTLEQVVGSEPVPPRSLNPCVPRDLETVCLKCLRKEPAQRYGSAAEFAEELRRFLAGEPIEGRPVGSLERAWRWCRRNPAVAALLTLVTATLVLGAAVATLFAFWALGEARRADGAAQTAQKEKHDAEVARTLAETESQRADAAAHQAQDNEQHALDQKRQAEIEKAEKERQLSRAEWLLYAGRLDRARQLWRDGDVPTAYDLLDGCRWDYRGFEHRLLETRFAGHAAFTLAPLQGRLRSVCFSPDGRRLAVGTADWRVQVWDLAPGRVPERPALSLQGHGHGVRSICFSPDGKVLVSASAPDNSQEPTQTGEVLAWDAGTGRRLFTIRSPAWYTRCLCFHPDGQVFAGGCSDATVRVWDARTGKEVFACKGHPITVSGVSFSPDGRRLASSCGRQQEIPVLGGEVRVWDAGNGREVLPPRRYPYDAFGVVYTPDGKELVSTYTDGTIMRCDARTGALLYSLQKAIAGGPVVSTDGYYLAAAGASSLVAVWPSGSAHQAFALKGHTKIVQGLGFAPDGRHLATASEDGTVKVWDLSGAAGGPFGEGDVRPLTGHEHWVVGLAFSPEGAGGRGRRLASASWDQTVKIWDCVSGQTLLTCRGHKVSVTCVCFSPDGKRLASGSADRVEPDKEGEVKIWDALTGQEVLTLAGHPRGVTGIAFSPDGRRLASASLDRTVKVWDAADGRQVLSLQGHTGGLTCVAYSPDGAYLATGAADQSVKLWDARDGRLVRSLPRLTTAITGLSFSPDGQRLAAASEQAVKVWAVSMSTKGQQAGGRELLSFRAPSGRFRRVCFSSDGRRLATGGDLLQLWDAAGGQELLSLKGLRTAVECLCFSPDDARLATAGSDGMIRLWDADRFPEAFTLRGHAGDVFATGFSPDGRRLACGSWGMVKVWDVQAGEELYTVEGHASDVRAVSFSADGKLLASGSSDCTAKVWEVGPGQVPVQPLLTLPHSGIVWSLCFSPDGRRLATGTENWFVKVWDLAGRERGGKEVLSLVGHSERVSAVCFSPDGRLLASGGWDRTVKVWDARTGRELFTLAGLAGPVGSVRFSPDGSRVIGVGTDREVRSWDARTGRPILPSPDPPGPLPPAALSPDGRRVARALGNQALVGPWVPGDKAPLPDRLADPARENAWHLRMTWEARRRSLPSVVSFHLRPLLLTSFTRWRQLAPDAFPTWAWRPPVSRAPLWYQFVEACPVSLAELRGLEEELTYQLASAPAAWEAWAARGWCRHLLDEPAAAVADLHRAIKQQPDEPGLWALLGTICVKHGRLEEAETVRRRLAGWPKLDAAVWHTWEAWACAAEGDAAAEHWHLSRLLERPAVPATTVRWLARRGAAALELGREAEAAADLDRALALDGEDTEALCWRARLSMARGDAATARRLCDTLVRHFDVLREPRWYELAARTVVLVPGVKPGTRLLSPPGLPWLEPAWRGGLSLRAGAAAAAVPLLSGAGSKRQPGAAPLPELLLALAYGQQGKTEEARRQLARARFLLEGEPPLQTAALAAAGAGGPLPLLVQAVGVQETRPRWDWATRLELRLLRQEAEALLR